MANGPEQDTSQFIEIDPGEDYLAMLDRQGSQAADDCAGDGRWDLFSLRAGLISLSPLGPAGLPIRDLLTEHFITED